MIKRIALLIIIFILSLPASTLAAEPNSGTIEGEVINRTAGESDVPNHAIILRTFLDNVELDPITTKTDALGSFIFEGLSTDAGYSYQLMLTFQEADYYSDWIYLDEWETSKVTAVTVYNATDSDEAIRVTNAHTVIYIGEGSLLVEEYLIFTNDADLTYIGSKVINEEGDKETLRFSIPRGATGFEPGSGLMECCIQSSADGFVDTMPVLPEDKLIVYSYKVDYSSGEYTLSKGINYDTDILDILVQGEGIIVTGDGLTVNESIIIEGVWYNHLSAQDLASGDTLTIHLSGLPKGTDNQNTVIWVLMILVILTSVSGLIYLSRKKSPQPVSTEDTPSQKKQRLLVELVQLDDDFAAGKIKEEQYHKLRQLSKAQLAELMQSPKEKGGGG